MHMLSASPWGRTPGGCCGETRGWFGFSAPVDILFKLQRKFKGEYKILWSLLTVAREKLSQLRRLQWLSPGWPGVLTLGEAGDMCMSPKDGIRFLLYSSPSSPRMKLPSPPCNSSYLGSEVGRKPMWTPQALIWTCILFTHYLWQSLITSG